MPDAYLVIDQPALDSELHSEQVAAGLIAESEPLVTAAQSAAPKLTGAGAVSIHGEVIRGGGELELRISWDRARYYMVFHEVGTRYLPARPFLAAGVN